jgi:hypothetical protein
MNIEPKQSVAPSRRRRTVVSAAIAVIATIPIATVASGASDEPTAADATESTVPTTGSLEDTAGSLEPNIDTTIVGDVVRLTFTLPDGWNNNGWFVNKANSDPSFGAIFDIVDNIFSDPCQWVEVSPQVGRTVDDLATAFANVPSLDATEATDVTVDGYHGKQIEFTVPDYTDDECVDGRFALYQNPGNSAINPNYWAQGPHAYHRLWILDVDGTRLVIGGTYFPDTSQQDVDDLDTILNSIRIDPVDAEQSGDDDPIETSAASSTSPA